MTTINYDLPIEDLVDALSATGHVTHESFAKTSVTFHHNGGVGNSHEDVLNTWKSRPASAHFDVDTSGMIAQYVKVDEFAWATGNNEGNQHSISIEMADFTGDPNWEISDVTWKAAARLAAWLFVHHIGVRPDFSNVFPHQHWVSTDCPGPWVMHNFSSIVGEVQAQYDHFLGSSTPSPTPAPQKSLQDVAHEVINGQWGNGPDRVAKLTAAGYDANAVQAEVNRELGASASPPPRPVPTPPPPKPTVGNAPPISLHILQMCAHEDPAKPQGQTTNSNQVVWVQKALVLEGLLSDSDPHWGRGSFGSMTVSAYKAWQNRLGYVGADADGIPGQASLSRLGSKWGFHVVA
jgi:hypothetical protein